MALTEAQRLARSGKLTASRVAPLMTGDKDKIMEVWREMVGDPTYQEPDLSDVWAVQLGVCTEELNLNWYEKVKKTTLTRRGEVVIHPVYDWAAATLDGYDPEVGPVEAKHVGGFEPIEKVIERYQPQCQWQMEVTGSDKCILSVIEGGRVPRLVVIERDADYIRELMNRAINFMSAVHSMTPPVVLEPVVIEQITRLKDYDFAGNNSWAAAAADWLQHQSAAKMWNKSVEAIKELMPNDAASGSGFGIVARRDKANRISIKSADDKAEQKRKR